MTSTNFKSIGLLWEGWEIENVHGSQCSTDMEHFSGWGKDWREDKVIWVMDGVICCIAEKVSY